jgi:hypothetical protein
MRDDDELAAIDLSAWEAPPAPAGLADAVLARMGDVPTTEVGAAIPLEPQPARRTRALVIGAASAATLALVLGGYALLSSTRPAGPPAGSVIADRARSLALDGVVADLDVGAEVRWQRSGSTLAVEQRAGAAAWRVADDTKLVIDAGATVASVEASGASLRVEVKMNNTDARVIGASALTAAAVSLVTVTVYSGHVKLHGAHQPPIVVEAGATHTVTPPARQLPEPPVVGGAIPKFDPARRTFGDVLIPAGESATIHVAESLAIVEVDTPDGCTLELVGRRLSGALMVLDPGTHRYTVRCSAGDLQGEVRVVRDDSARPLAKQPARNEITANGLSYIIGYDGNPPEIDVRGGRGPLHIEGAGRELVFDTPSIPAGALEDGDHALWFAPDRVTTLVLIADPAATIAEVVVGAQGWTDPVTVEGRALAGSTVSFASMEVTPGDDGRFIVNASAPDGVLAVRVAHPRHGVHYHVLREADPPPRRTATTRVATRPPCDAEELKDRGMEFINMGEHARALAALEQSYACKPDRYTLQLVFMEACSAKDTRKARTYYARLTPDQQSKFKVICIRNGVEFDEANATHPATADHGFLDVHSKPSATILIDNVEMGQTEIDKPLRLQLTPGKHKVTFVVDGDRYTYPVVIKAGATEAMVKDLR